MVTITNGTKTFRVPAGAVKPYKSMGFHVISDKEQKEMRQTQNHFNDASEPANPMGSEYKDDDGQKDGYKDGGSMSTDEDAFIEELLEKPLSQWSNEEMKAFVKAKDIDTSSAQKASQVRGIIKTYLEEQNKNE